MLHGWIFSHALLPQKEGGSLASLSRVLTLNSFCSLFEILELAEDMEIDIPHVWLYLAELVMPILQDGGVSMGELFR